MRAGILWILLHLTCLGLAQQLVWEWSLNCDSVGVEAFTKISAASNEEYLLYGTCQNVPYLMRVNSIGDTLSYLKLDTITSGYGVSDLIETTDKGFILVGNAGFLSWMGGFDSTGRLQWQHTTNSNAGLSRCDAIVPLNDGGFLICGNRLTDNFSKYNDVYACRLDSNGQILWERHYPLDNYQFARDLVEMPDGSFFLSGYTELQLGGVWQALPYVLQIDIWGYMIAEYYLQPTGFSNMNPNFSKIILLPDGNVVISGHDSNPAISRQAFMAKIDSTAQIVWDELWFRASGFIPKALSNGSVISHLFTLDSGTILLEYSPTGLLSNSFTYPSNQNQFFSDISLSSEGFLIGAGNKKQSNNPNWTDFYAARYDSVGEAFVPDYCAWHVPEAAFYAEYDWPLLTLRDSSFSGLRYHDSIYHYQWYSSNGDMSTGDSLTTLFDTTGGQSIDITLIVSNWHGCKDTLSQTIDLQSTILQEKKQAEVSIYPNPVMGNELFIASAKEIDQISLFDIRGHKQEISISNTENNQWQVKLDNGIPKGLYFVKLIFNNAEFDIAKILVD